ncbi:MAG: type II toxin-antitoxin system RelE/ParE family toxin [Bryobacteraceae bacterium]
MPVHRVVRQVTGESTGQVLPPVGTSARDGPRTASADFLRDGIYELRVSLGGVHHRILYFFHDAIAAVVSHGLVKERAVPPKEIDRAVERKKRFEANPARHTYEEA